tara:strand:+ start:40 stop:768 length:729 start_codon:yes stop_codon:yes gene_type:complete
MNNKNIEFSVEEFNHIERNNNHHIFFKKLKNIKNPIILELGVNKGSSTAKFLDYVNTFGGELYSVDIVDCSKIIHTDRFKNILTEKWNFIKSNDLNIEYIFSKFPLLEKGVDLIYIDSYHDYTHVQKILKKWFFYIRKHGYIFFDDTESCQYRKIKDFSHSVNNDSIDALVKDFHYRNYNQVVLTKYYSGSGLSELFKLSEFASNADFSSNVWNYNSLIGNIYLYLKKIIYSLKNKDKKNDI